ncbi:predicted protein [Sclerotinia sclerotiorum 1980 UF-70]|uniref:Uncharacterized protein n=1 Tax=Sclerotinia sclerotiorum (strain ATCC 18683 / 1980 / Ss-1) TaxID=665079 RepID=A7ECS3_SCLS1|nr:predicted protein [Sclerotinia sclerotiorum 1980 UF-70]EDO00639.1 predicted protein [Sclerotinia sclerotiorum 1980 UF-70]
MMEHGINLVLMSITSLQCPMSNSRMSETDPQFPGEFRNPGKVINGLSKDREFTLGYNSVVPRRYHALNTHWDSNQVTVFFPDYRGL